MAQHDLLREIGARLQEMGEEREHLEFLYAYYSDPKSDLSGLGGAFTRVPATKTSRRRGRKENTDAAKPSPLEVARAYFHEHGIATRREISAAVKAGSNTTSGNVDNMVSGVLGNRKNFTSYGRGIYTLANASDDIRKRAAHMAGVHEAENVAAVKALTQPSKSDNYD